MSLAFPTASNTLFPLVSRSRCQRALGFYDVLPKEQHQRNGNLVPCRVDQEDPDTESYYQLSKFKRKEQGWEHSPFLCKPRAEICLLVLHPLRNVPAHTDCQVSLEFMQSIIPVKNKIILPSDLQSIKRMHIRTKWLYSHVMPWTLSCLHFFLSSSKLLQG